MKATEWQALHLDRQQEARRQESAKNEAGEHLQDFGVAARFHPRRRFISGGFSFLGWS
jgi:hypothetical protein